MLQSKTGLATAPRERETKKNIIEPRHEKTFLRGLRPERLKPASSHSEAS